MTDESSETNGGGTATQLVRPKWTTDLARIAAVVVFTYALVFVLGLLAGLNLDSVMSFLHRITLTGAVFAMAALALNLHWGYTGLFNIGIIGFMGVSVYTMSVATASPSADPAGFGLPLPVGIVLGFLAACLAGFIIGLPALRVRADYFAIITLGFSEIVRLAVTSGSLQEVGPGGRYGTGGGSGISAPSTDQAVLSWLQSQPVTGELVDAITFVGVELGGIHDTVVENYIYTSIVIGIVVLVFLLMTRISYSPFGRVLKAIREDELAAKSLGKRTDRAKIVVFVLGCGLMGLAGMLWLGRNTLVNPNSFRPVWTFYIFVALIVGGSGSNTGSIIGGFVFAAYIYDGPRYVTRVIEAFRDVSAPATIDDAIVQTVTGDPLTLFDYLVTSLDEIKYIILGVVLVTLMIKRPEGLLGHRTEVSAAVDLSQRTATGTDPATAANSAKSVDQNGGDSNE